MSTAKALQAGMKAAHPLQTPEKTPQAEKPSPKPKPRTSQAKFHICYVQVFSTTVQKAEGKSLGWTMYRAHKCTDFSETLMK